MLLESNGHSSRTIQDVLRLEQLKGAQGHRHTVSVLNKSVIYYLLSLFSIRDCLIYIKEKKNLLQSSVMKNAVVLISKQMYKAGGLKSEGV